MKSTTERLLLAIIITAVLSACETTTPPPPGFGIRVTHEKLTIQIDMIIRGTAFTPNGRVMINISGHPRRGDIGPLFTTANSDGTFERRESFSFSRVPRDEELARIRVAVRDEASGNAVSESVSAEPYVIRF